MRSAPSLGAVLRGALSAIALLTTAASAQPRPAWEGSKVISTKSATEQIFDLPRDGKTHRVLLTTPERVRGAIIMLPGGTGNVGLERDGDIRHSNNFVVRTRALWASRGYAVLIPDGSSHGSLRGVRSSPSYGGFVNDLIEYARRNVSHRVFLMGTSQGSIAAINGAAQAADGSVAGIVLTESVSVMGGSGETVFSADPQRVRAPALIVADRDDRCKVAPPQAAARIAAAMTESREVQVLSVSGGFTRSRDDCGSLTPHGYYGIEQEVVAKVSQWMDIHD